MWIPEIPKSTSLFLVVCLRYRCFLCCVPSLSLFLVVCLRYRCVLCVVCAAFCASLLRLRAHSFLWQSVWPKRPKGTAHTQREPLHTMSSAEEMAKVIGLCYGRDLKALAAVPVQQDSVRCFIKFKDALKLGSADLEDHVFFSGAIVGE